MINSRSSKGKFQLLSGYEAGACIQMRNSRSSKGKFLVLSGYRAKSLVLLASALFVSWESILKKKILVTMLSKVHSSGFTIHINGWNHRAMNCLFFFPYWYHVPIVPNDIHIKVPSSKPRCFHRCSQGSFNVNFPSRPDVIFINVLNFLNVNSQAYLIWS